MVDLLFVTLGLESVDTGVSLGGVRGVDDEDESWDLLCKVLGMIPCLNTVLYCTYYEKEKETEREREEKGEIPNNEQTFSQKSITEPLRE